MCTNPIGCDWVIEGTYEGVKANFIKSGETDFLRFLALNYYNGTNNDHLQHLAIEWIKEER